MNVLVVGLNHQIQRAGLLSGGEEIEKLEKQQKDRFAEYLTRVIKERHPGLIGEEAQHGVDLIGQCIAAQFECAHINVDMPPDLRQARGIPTDYTREDRPYTAEQRRNWHREREQYMFEQVAHHRVSGNTIVLCGREHVTALASLFADAGYTVETDDLNCQEWYIEDWLMHVMGL